MMLAHMKTLMVSELMARVLFLSSMPFFAST